MSDPFQILGDEFEVPPSFEEAVQGAVERLQAAAERFAALYEAAPEERFTPEERRVVELAAEDIADAVERAQEGYVAVQYDSHAWYRIIENMERVRTRLESAAGLMERVRDRG